MQKRNSFNCYDKANGLSNAIKKVSRHQQVSKDMSLGASEIMIKESSKNTNLAIPKNKSSYLSSLVNSGRRPMIEVSKDTSNFIDVGTYSSLSPMVINSYRLNHRNKKQMDELSSLSPRSNLEQLNYDYRTWFVSTKKKNGDLPRGFGAW